MCKVNNSGGIGSFNWLVKSSAEKNKDDENVDTICFCDRYTIDLYNEEEVDEGCRLTLSDAENIHSLDDPRLKIKANDPLGVVYTKSEVFQKVKDRLEGKTTVKKSSAESTAKPLSLADADKFTDPNDPRLAIKPEDSLKTIALKYAIIAIVKGRQSNTEDSKSNAEAKTSEYHKTARAFAFA